MITQLTIKNFALIEDIKVDFKEGLTIITGETGAGKSILLGALSLLLGKRADLSSVKNSSKKCVIEAEFQINDYHLNDFFQSQDLDYEPQTIIRREILPSGKSRAFINDSPVNLTILSILGERLIDIHNQHQTLEVSSKDFQFELIDSLAQTKNLLETYKRALKEFKSNQFLLNQLNQKKADAQKEQEFNQFLFDELEQANLKEGELEILEEELERLNNVETIQEHLSQMVQHLNDEQVGALVLLNEIKLRANKLKSLSASFEALWERIQSVHIELDDVYSDITSEIEAAEANPERLALINDRLQLLYKLQSKHQAQNTEELIAIKNKLSDNLLETENLDTRIKELELKIKQSRERLTALASEIHDKRASVLDTLIKSLEEILAQLGLPNARFKIELKSIDTFLENGSDALSFLFTANKGTEFGDLKKVASGGEMSRIMLAIKSILTNYSQLPTIVFDEIDTGVSGEVANKIAEIMKNMSTKMQVISITHLPQIAAKGNHHFKVFKEDIQNETQTKLKLLSKENRVFELAEMLGGEKKSESALAHARELLN
ncbi:MAG: DNA repair protein RecN [Flavobacteriaceae bacterium]|nr:DNA repair protein RecN [Flavobacteriaceae bacterium]